METIIIILLVVALVITGVLIRHECVLEKEAKQFRKAEDRKEKIKLLIKAYLLTLPKLKGGYKYSKRVNWNKVRVRVSQRLWCNAWDIIYRKTLTLKD